LSKITIASAIPIRNKTRGIRDNNSV